MAHEVLNMTEFNTINEQIRNEKSRTVKIILVKYKCIFLFTFLFLSLGQFIYIMIDKFGQGEDIHLTLRKMSASFASFASLMSNTKLKDDEVNR